MAISRLVTKPFIGLACLTVALAATAVVALDATTDGHSTAKDVGLPRFAHSATTSTSPAVLTPSVSARAKAARAKHPKRSTRTRQRHSASHAAPSRSTSTRPPHGGGSPPPHTAKPPTANGPGPLARPLYNDISSRNDWAAYKRATDPTQKNLLYQLAGTPLATWLGASANQADVNRVQSAASARGQTPVFVTYAIPHRDCGGLSAGGLQSAAQYRSWVDAVRAGIGGRPAVVIIEPDAMGYGCLPAAEQADRIAELKYEVDAFARDRNTFAYIHAGPAGINPGDMARALKRVDVHKIRGFALNVSGYDTTSSEIAYGKALDKGLGRKLHFVIDTSRNGVGRNPSNASCNPPGRAVGTRPTTRTGSARVDAFLWVHTAGGSDGQCHPGDPSPGVFMPSYAVGMVQLALNRGIISRVPTPT